jgi:hypothetical protein
MLKFEEIGEVETDASGDMLPGVYSIPGVGFIVVGQNKETVIIRQWDHQTEFSRSDVGFYPDIKPWHDSKKLKLVEVLDAD